MNSWREQIWAVIECAEEQCSVQNLQGVDREKFIRAARPYWVRTCSWQTKLWQEEMQRLFGRHRSRKESPADPTQPILPGM